MGRREETRLNDIINSFADATGATGAQAAEACRKLRAAGKLNFDPADIGLSLRHD